MKTLKKLAIEFCQTFFSLIAIVLAVAALYYFK